MANIPENSNTYDVETENKTWKKMKDAPFVPIGVAGMIGAVIYGAYNFKNRGNMKVSVYLMHMRVKAQGMVVGAMALGVGYSLISDYLKQGRPEAHTDVDKLH